MNEAASLRYISEVTNIPVPKLYCDFEDNGAYYLITEYVEGVSLSDLDEDEKTVVCRELEEHLVTLHALKSQRIGGPSEIVIPPYRVTLITEEDEWSLESSENVGCVFCHNDLSQHNVVVDPSTLKVKAILDWEHASFYPEFFEFPFYKRLGPSAPLDGEPDDGPLLLEYLDQQRASKA